MVPFHIIHTRTMRSQIPLLAKRCTVGAFKSHIDGSHMPKLDDRTIANIEVALNDAFRAYPHGGDHETRKHVARRLLQSAHSGNTTLGGLETVAKAALTGIAKRKPNREESNDNQGNLRLP
jgi:hypothetical protein